MLPKLIQEWVNAKKEITKAKEVARKVLEKAVLLELPTNLRPAEPKDVVEGNILWYPDFGQEEEEGWDALAYWKFIGEVESPSSKWKAFTAHDGCRYGIEGAFVEIKS